MLLRFIAVFAFVVTLLPEPAQAKVLDVQELTTPKGITVWLVQDDTLPVISMAFSFDGGLALDPPEKPGVGRLVSILLDEGAGDMESQTFQKKLSDNAIEMSFSAGRDAFTGQLRTLTDKQDMAWDLLKLALTDPRFDDDAITRMKQANSTQIKNSMGDPSWLVARTFNGMAFDDHAYGQPGHGNLKTMQTITREDLQTYTKQQFTLPALKVSLTGDINAEQAIQTVDTVFGDLPDTATPVTDTDIKLHHSGKTILLPLDVPQTFIMAGQDGISHKDDDWHAATIMNYILGGGGFESRLMHEIREKRGLTYGVYSSLSSMKYATLVSASLSTSNTKAAEALNLLKQEWRKMAQNGVTEAELEHAKSYLTGSLLLDLTSSKAIAGTLNSLQSDGYTYDYINHYTDKINAVTQEDIKKVAQRLLTPEQLTVVLVGKPEDITPDITLEHAPNMGLGE